MEIPLCKIYTDDREVQAVKEVLDSDGKIISVDCKLNENVPTEKSRSNLHKTDKQYYSRNDLIAAGNLLIDFKDELKKSNPWNILQI